MACSCGYFRITCVPNYFIISPKGFLGILNLCDLKILFYVDPAAVSDVHKNCEAKSLDN